MAQGLCASSISESHGPLTSPKCSVLPASLTGQQRRMFSLQYSELVSVGLNPARIHWASISSMVPYGTRGFKGKEDKVPVLDSLVEKAKTMTLMIKRQNKLHKGNG